MPVSEQAIEELKNAFLPKEPINLDERLSRFKDQVSFVVPVKSNEESLNLLNNLFAALDLMRKTKTGKNILRQLPIDTHFRYEKLRNTIGAYFVGKKTVSIHPIVDDLKGLAPTVIHECAHAIHADYDRKNDVFENLDPLNIFMLRYLDEVGARAAEVRLMRDLTRSGLLTYKEADENRFIFYKPDTTIGEIICDIKDRNYEPSFFVEGFRCAETDFNRQAHADIISYYQKNYPEIKQNDIEQLESRFDDCLKNMDNPEQPKCIKKAWFSKYEQDRVERYQRCRG